MVANRHDGISLRHLVGLDGEVVKTKIIGIRAAGLDRWRVGWLIEISKPTRLPVVIGYKDILRSDHLQSVCVHVARIIRLPTQIIGVVSIVIEQCGIGIAVQIVTGQEGGSVKRRILNIPE